MARIYVNKLNDNVKNNILQSNYTINEMLQIKEFINNELKRKKKVFNIITIIMLCFLTLMLVPTFMQVGLNGVFIAVLIVMLIFMSIVILSTYFITIGILKIQYNNSVKKAYLLNYDTLHDYQLVNQINECYQHNEKRFLEILQLIAQREKEKIYKLFGYNIEVNDIDCIRFIVRDILTHICDDKDLECIILYCKKS